MPLSGSLHLLRRFALVRPDTDVSGVSGTGVVALGVVTHTGCVFAQWTEPGEIVVQPRGLAAFLSVHGHDGATVVRWIDEAPDA